MAGRVREERGLDSRILAIPNIPRSRMPFHRLFSSLLAAALCMTPWIAAADAGADLRQKLSLPEDVEVREWVGGRTIIAYAVPHPQAAADKEEGVDYLDLTLQVVDTKTGEVVARSFVENGIVSDAMHFDGLAIDAADYTLAPGVRAFGLRVKSSHVGLISADAVDMRLFEVRRPAIVEVMPSVTMRSSSGDRNCEESHEMTRTLEIAKTSTRGRADIVLHDRQVEGTGSPGADGDCRMKETRSEHRVTLHFDGKSYPLPKGFY
jgi:hypothetical protein